ncbi:S-formylglutathione hydrolase [Francisellaceae bacterium]|nr:S-formylglutathione hydrolase [Francisellaceae bacterium]
MKELSKNKSFGGWQKRFEHESDVLRCSMKFSVYIPAIAETQNVPVLYWLSGLTCTDENFVQKAGAQRMAAELGIMLVMPDTSPRGENVPDDPDKSYDFGLGAGFYINATQAPWNKNYKMFDYISIELPMLIEANFPVTNRKAISGHSMGGHGALISGLKNPGAYTSISAFSPISNPINCPWGKKAFTNYLGHNKFDWEEYDASMLITQAQLFTPILVDQGTNDDFLKEQLLTSTLEEASTLNHYPIEVRYQSGYDHSYFFIASFIEAHLIFHAQYLF